MYNRRDELGLGGQGSLLDIPGPFGANCGCLGEVEAIPCCARLSIGQGAVFDPSTRNLQVPFHVPTTIFALHIATCCRSIVRARAVSIDDGPLGVRDTRNTRATSTMPSSDETWQDFPKTWLPRFRRGLEHFPSHSDLLTTSESSPVAAALACQHSRSTAGELSPCIHYWMQGSLNV